MRQVLAEEAVDLEIAAGQQQVLRRQALEFGPKQCRVHRRDDRRLRGGGLDGARLVRPRTAGQQFAA